MKLFENKKTSIKQRARGKHDFRDFVRSFGLDLMRPSQRGIHVKQILAARKLFA